MPNSSRPLVIVDRYPLPAVTGGRQRMWNFLLAVASLGPADLIVLEDHPQQGDKELTRVLPDWEVAYIPLQRRRRSKFRRVADTVLALDPEALASRDLDGTASRLRAIADGRRVVIAIQPVSIEIAERVRGSAPLLADLWDVYHVSVAREMKARAQAEPMRAARRLWLALRTRAEIRGWQRFAERLVTTAEIVTVCSDTDRRYMPGGESRIAVVPNGADLERPERRNSLGPAPTLLFHGQLSYYPNVDAARRLVTEIAPLVRHEVPDLRVRIVGRADDRVRSLADPPSVEVTGFVDKIEDELERAWVLVVPLAIGGGTRLKILEAFAAGLPVVTTSIGVEGIDAVDDQHVLVADEPETIAEATVRLLRNDSERRRLAEAAHQLVSERYGWDAIRSDLSAMIESLAIARSDAEHVEEIGRTHGQAEGNDATPSDRP